MAATIIETDGFFLSSQPVATYGPFKLMGGYYGVAVTSGASGTALLSKVLADGSTVPIPNSTPLTAGSYTVLQLLPGLYQVAIGTGASDVAVAKIKGGI
jgi:hypothetical protein